MRAVRASPAASPPATHAKAGKGRRAGALGKLEGRLLHGQFVVLGKDKKPTTLAEQRGTVSAVSPTSISFTSTDGFKQTYVVDSATKVRVDGKKSAIADVKTGQTATVIAGVTGSGRVRRAGAGAAQRPPLGSGPVAPIGAATTTGSGVDIRPRRTSDQRAR